MLDQEAKNRVKHAAREFIRLRSEDQPVIIVIQPVEDLDEHDLYALLAINLEDPSVFRVGISLMEMGECPLDPDGHIDWGQAQSKP